MPALEAGRCAQYQGGELFEHFHFSIFRAYFEENRDISNREVLIEIGKNTGLDVTCFKDDLERGKGRAELEAETKALMAKGDFIGVPTVFFGTPYPIYAAVPDQVYQRAVERLMTS
jgi:predicted DsbA family dithiol-disulfide isomerase